MSQRRVNLTPRPPRRRKTPAYQVRPLVRHTGTTPSNASPSSNSNGTRAEPVLTDEPIVQEHQVVEHARDLGDEPIARGDTEAFVTVGTPAEVNIASPDVTKDIDGEPTPTKPEVAESDVSADTTISSPDEEQAATESPDTSTDGPPQEIVRTPPAQAVMDTPPAPVPVQPGDPPIDGDSEPVPAVPAAPVAVTETSEDEDYAAYVQSVEAAAARSRAELQRQTERNAQSAGTAVPASTATAVYPTPPGNVEIEQPVERPPRRGGSGGRGGGRRGPGDWTAAGFGRPLDPRPRWKRPKTWLITTGIVVALAVIAGLVYTVYLALAVSGAYEEAQVPRDERGGWVINEQGTPVPISPEEVEQRLPNWDEDEPVNILLLGVDYREGDTEPARSDTLIVVRVDPATREVSMMSLPRDLWVYIPEVDRWDKVNAAFPVGEFIEEGYGASVVAQTVEYNFGIDVHYYMTIDFRGFRTVIDRLGGIIVDVEAPIKDDQYPTDEFGLTRAYFDTGLQKMDGESALRFARTRHGDNDVARGERQQQVLMAVRAKATTLDLIWDVQTITNIVEDVGESVRTDLEFNQMLALAQLGRGIDPANIRRVNLWEEGVLTEHVSEGFDDPFYFEADWDRVYELVKEYFPAQTPEPVANATPGASPNPLGRAPTDTSDAVGVEAPDLSVPIIVQDTSTNANSGTGVASILIDAGFESVTNETSPDIIANTIIYDYADEPATARYIARQLGLDESSIVYGFGGNGIVVAAGDDFAAQ